MPWKKVLPMEEKLAFIMKVKEENLDFAGVCRRFGVSRRTGYKWWRRYQAEGLLGLDERSHRPRSCPHAGAGVWTERLIELRLRHPHWGPKKLRVKLVAAYGAAGVPAVSTLGARLRAAGLVAWRRRRQWPRPWRERGDLSRATAANEVWGVDFKGWFRTGDGQRCDPLTISDLYSRYVLCCRVAAEQSYAAVRPLFEAVFKAYGLPAVIRVDNGSPFASTGAGGLSRLSVWWVGLGIRTEFITPGHPEENGVHERMHRTLKAETTKPPAGSRAGQQARFDEWRQEFNTERPHEALGQEVPAKRYQRSGRRYRAAMEPEYPGGYKVRRVRSNGQIKWGGGKRYVSEAMVGRLVGLCWAEPGRWEVWFGKYLLGDLYENEPGGLRPSVSVHQARQLKPKVLPISPV